MKKLFLILSLFIGFTLQAQIPIDHPQGLALPRFETAPEIKFEGQLYYKPSTEQLFISKGSAWRLIDNVPIVADYTALQAITGMANGDIVYVSDNDKKGYFKFNADALLAYNDFGIEINGWIRQFEGDIQAEWFDAGGDDDFNINYALLAAGATPVKVNKDITVNSSILIASNQTIDFGTSIITPVAPMTGSAVIKNRNVTDTNITIKGGEIIGTAEATVTYGAVLLDSVYRSTVKDMIIKDVSILAASDSGNILVTGNSSNIIIDNVHVTGTWRAGVYVLGGLHNTIRNSYFNATRDSGIIMVNSDYGVIENNLVDNCGQGSVPDGASNITANMVNGIFRGNVSINAGGTINGNGFTLGHPLGYDAHDNVIEGNFFGFNYTKGLFLQGTATDGNTITNNIFLGNGAGSTGTNSSGLGIAGGTRNIISNNVFDGNRYGISIDSGNTSNVIQGNVIENSISAGIRDAGISTKIQNNILRANAGGSFLAGQGNTLSSYVNNNEATELNSTIKGFSSTSVNRFTNALVRYKQLDQVNNTSVGFTMATSTTDLYGMHVRTERLTGGTDFRYVISAHKNTEAGVDLFEIDDLGNVIMIGNLILSGLPTHADEAAAVTAGLATGTVYKTATGELRIKL